MKNRKSLFPSIMVTWQFSVTCEFFFSKFVTQCHERRAKLLFWWCMRFSVTSSKLSEYFISSEYYLIHCFILPDTCDLRTIEIGVDYTKSRPGFPLGSTQLLKPGKTFITNPGRTALIKIWKNQCIWFGSVSTSFKGNYRAHTTHWTSVSKKLVKKNLS